MSMEQKTVISIEFAKGEEMIATAVMALIAAVRSDKTSEDMVIASLLGVAEERKEFKERPSNETSRPTNSRREEPEEDDRDKKYTETQLRDMPVKELINILKKEFGVDPNDYDGKNSNKKLRDLILDAQTGTLNSTDSGSKEDGEDDERRSDRGNRQDSVTHDDVRDLMADVIEEDDANRIKVLKQLNKIGAKSVGMIKDDDLVDFFEFLQSLKEG